MQTNKIEIYTSVQLKRDKYTNLKYTLDLEIFLNSSHALSVEVGYMISKSCERHIASLIVSYM